MCGLWRDLWESHLFGSRLFWMRLSAVRKNSKWAPSLRSRWGLSSNIARILIGRAYLVNMLKFYPFSKACLHFVYSIQHPRSFNMTTTLVIIRVTTLDTVERVELIRLKFISCAPRLKLIFGKELDFWSDAGDMRRDRGLIRRPNRGMNCPTVGFLGFI
jgi:hypothetical protein